MCGGRERAKDEVLHNQEVCARVVVLGQVWRAIEECSFKAIGKYACLCS